MSSAPGDAPGRRSRLSLHSIPLRVRLVTILVLLLLTALVATSFAASMLLRGYLLDRTDTELQQASDPLAQAAYVQFVTDRPTSVERFVAPNAYTIRISAAGGQDSFFFTDPPNEQDRPDLPDLAPEDPRVRSGEPFTVGSVEGSSRWRVVAGQTASPEATFAVAVPLDSVDNTLQRVWLLTILLGLVTGALCAVLGWFAVRRALRPLTRIEDTAAAIASGDLGRRVPERHARDEVTSLSRSLNVMLGRIEQSFAVREASEERMRRFVADASHELRTPLATVRGYAELYRQGAVQDPHDVSGAMERIENEATRMGGLVEDLLLLTRLDSQRPASMATEDLTVLAGDAVQDAEVRDPERSIVLHGLNGQLAPAPVLGDESRLRQVITNLVANALAHTPAGTPVELVVGTATLPDRTDTPSGRTVLEVRDHGPGIDPAVADRVFERFFRADPSRGRSTGGSGLGLAIVAAIVDGHGGQVSFRRTEGGGSTFRVDLPSADSQGTPSTP